MFKQLIALAASAVLAGQALAGPNLINNGDFEAGNTGFTSGYTYVANQGYAALWGEGTYSVGANSDLYHGLWANVSNHTVGGNNFMIINGAPNTDTVVWKSNTMTLGPGTYNFSAYVTDICCNSFFNGYDALPQLSFTAASADVPPVTFMLSSSTLSPDAPGIWYQFTGSFTLFTGMTGYVSLGNADGAYSGNDFGIDDISLTQRTGEQQQLRPSVPEPATWAMMVGGFGLVGGALRRRQRSMLSAA
jgi:hypothetical protein